MDSGEPREACIRWGSHWRHLANAIEPSMCSGNARPCYITVASRSIFIFNVFRMCGFSLLVTVVAAVTASRRHAAHTHTHTHTQTDRQTSQLIGAWRENEALAGDAVSLCPADNRGAVSAARA